MIEHRRTDPSRRGFLKGGLYAAAGLAGMSVADVIAACGGGGGGSTNTSSGDDVQKAYDTFVKKEMPGVSIDLLRAAQKEGTVTGYLQLAYGEMLSEAFKKVFPFVEVQATVLTGGPLVSKFLSESRAGRFTVDIVDFASLTDFATAKSENFVMPYKISSAAEFNFKQAVEGYSFPITGDVLGIAYNPQKISDSQAKSLSTWESLMDSKWNGKRFAVSEVLAGGTTQLLNYYLYQKFGTQLWQRMARSGYAVYPGGNPVIASVVSGENDIGVGVPSSLETVAFNKQSPIHWINPQDWLVTSYVQFITSHAPHPNAAKLFQEFSATPTVQKLMLGNSGVTYRKGVTAQDALSKEKWFVKPDPDKYWPYEVSAMAAALPGIVPQWRAIFK